MLAAIKKGWAIDLQYPTSTDTPLVHFDESREPSWPRVDVVQVRSSPGWPVPIWFYHATVLLGLSFTTVIIIYEQAVKWFSRNSVRKPLSQHTIAILFALTMYSIYVEHFILPIKKRLSLFIKILLSPQWKLYTRHIYCKAGDDLVEIHYHESSVTIWKSRLD